MDPERALIDLVTLASSFLSKTADLLRKYADSKPEIRPPPKSRKKPKDPNREKQPKKQSAYMLYSAHVMPEMRKLDEYKSETYADLPISQLSKVIGAQWHKLPAEEKSCWREKAGESAVPTVPKQLDPALLSLLEEDTVEAGQKRPRSDSMSATESESE